MSKKYDFTNSAKEGYIGIINTDEQLRTLVDHCKKVGVGCVVTHRFDTWDEIVSYANSFEKSYDFREFYSDDSARTPFKEKIESESFERYLDRLTAVLEAGTGNAIWIGK